MKSIGFDQIASGTVVSADTLAQVIDEGSAEGKQALAEALAGLGPDDPQATTVEGLTVDTGTKTAAATAGAATLNKNSGLVTSEALTTAAGDLYTLTITNSKVAAGDLAFAAVRNGTNTQGTPAVQSVDCNATEIVVVVKNTHASEALNGTLQIGFMKIEG